MRKRKINQRPNQGFSLLEVLVVISVFAILAIISSQTVLLTLRGARKSTAVAKVRQNLDFALAIIERQLHNASEINPCPNLDPTILTFKDQYGNDASFSCQDLDFDGFIASGSGRLTSEEIAVLNCSFSCSDSAEGALQSVTVDLVAKDANLEGSEGSTVTVSTQIFLRTY